ncbi:hypothetical protein Pfo_031528 [Paulownia fortunei]|nr:hypothetical protein Pfo_031528 [Paulownia fortunei]
MFLNFMVWNVRGIGNEPTQKHVHNFCRLHKIKIIVVLEPKVQLDSNFFCRRFAFSHVYANCSNKIWCFVNNEFQCKILSDQEQFLHMEVKSHLLPSAFLLTFIYAKCDITGRRELWSALRDIAEQNDAQPWLIGGDFNTILHLNERTGNNGNRLTLMNDFGDMIGDSGLIDAGYEGSSYTWTNHKVWKRLDRVLYSEEWLNLFHITKVSHLPRIWSDHSPLLISLDTDKIKAPSPFRFFRMWSRHHTFWNTVKDSWRHPTETQGMKNLQQKLFRLKHKFSRIPKLKNSAQSLNMEEIRQAVFSMDPDSVAGPDGFSAFFYQHCWDIIHMDIKEAVVDFFKGNSMPRSFTATSIVLISKTENPKTWGDFRPISLCNVNNKIFTKIISNRLVNILPEIISPAQSGFVKGRLISDNILLAQELTHTINAKRKHENVALKLDMNKAYDRIQWSFLYKVLKKMGFPETWITLVQNCIEHCWFSVLINGLRQGDPLSPSLFIIAADFLSRSLDTLFQHNKELRYHSKGGLNISHLAYADDIIIFTNSGRMGLRKIMELLRKYAAASGQIINKEKSSFIVSTKCSNLIIQRLQYATGFNFKHLPITYLGPRSTKMRYKLQGWEKSTLAHGGRLALIKNTLSTMPIYLLQVLQPPKMVLHRIEQIMARFFWGTYGDQKRMHWVSWDRICQPVKEWGLGIRKLADMVQAFSLKLWWRFRSLTSLWAAFMQQKYSGCLFPGAIKISVHDSSNWKRMCKVRQTAQENIYWVLGMVKLIFGKITGSVKPLLQQPTAPWELWCNQLTPTMSIFVWRLMNNCIPVDNRLQEKEFSLVSRCYCCLSSVESIPHLFISGAQATVVWKHFANLFNIKHPQTENPILLFQYWKLSTPFSKPTHIRIIIPLLIFWFLWTERNNAKYRNKGFHAHRVIWKIYDHLFCLFKCRKMDRKIWRGDMEIATSLNFNFPMEKIKKQQQVLWKKPQVGWFKLNTDGAAKGETGQAGAASRGTEGTAGVGGIIRDHLGDPILAFQDFIEPASSIFSELGITHLWIEINALAVIHILRSSALEHWRLQQLLVDIKNGNRVTDFLANAACDTTSSRTFMAHELSGHILGFIRLDQLGTPSFRHL